MDPLFADFQSLLAMSKEKAEKNIQEALNYIRLDYKNLSVAMGQYHPLEILKMAAWEERRITRTRANDQFASATARLLPVLLQSIIQSTLYDVSHGIPSNRDLRDKDWQRIRSLVDDVSRRLLRSIECYTVLAVKSGKIEEENALRFRALLFEEVFPPAEDLDRVERLSYMTYASMKADANVIKEKYGVDPERLVDQMYRIIRRGLEGIDKLSEEASIYKSEVETLMAQKRSQDPTRIITDEDLVHEIVKENGWEGRVNRLAGERDDFDLFRPDFVSNLPDLTYKTLSVSPGTLDLDDMMLKKGLWPATIYPFIRFGNMYFSFVSQHIHTYSLRILQETAGLYLRYTEATTEALNLLFREGEEVDVYVFDGNKIDVSILSSLEEVNTYVAPELFQSRMVRRKEEASKKPRIGHKLLIVEPDNFEGLRQIGDDIFACSSYCIIKTSTNPAAKKEFCRTIFGQLEIPEPTEYDAIIDPDEIENEEKIDDDILSDDITDEYEYESEDEDECEKRIEEKEKLLEQSIPEDNPSYERSVEIEKLAEKYALTNEIIKRDEEAEAEADEYEKELDDDDFSYDEEELPNDILDDVDPEAESIYEEAEKVDEYADDSYTDPDQLTFFDDLFNDDELKEADKIADEEFTAEDEEEYEKSEEEAVAFSSSDVERLPNSIMEENSADSAEETLDEFPCFKPDEEASEDNQIAEEPITHAEEKTENSAVEETREVLSEKAEEEALSESSDEDLVTEEEPAAYAEEKTEDSAVDETREVLPEKAEEEALSESSDEDRITEEEPVASAEEKTETPIVKETTETLIEKGLVKPSDTEEEGGRVFVMTENAVEMVPEEEPVKPSRPKLSGILEKIANRLDETGPFLRFLFSADEEMKDYLAKVIRSSWERQLSDGKDKMFSIFDYSISVILSANRINDSLRRETLLNNVSEEEVSEMLGRTERSEQLQRLDDALAALPADERALILLFYMQEKTVDEVAAISGLTPANVKVKLHRIRKKLYVLLKGMEEE